MELPDMTFKGVMKLFGQTTITMFAAGATMLVLGTIMRFLVDMFKIGWSLLD